MTIYDKKGEPGARQVYHVGNYSKISGGATATINSEMFDKKGNSIAKGTNQIKCVNGIMMMDMKLSMPQAQNSPLSDADVKADNVFIEYPSVLNTGDNLKDGHLQMDMDNRGMKQAVTMDITNRKVEAKESVTTPAGTWDCYKITNKTKMKIKTFGIGIPMTMEVTEWFAPGFGVVKTKSRSGETVITSIK